ncbi:cytochrome c [Algoriphagus boseongensis]|uniref:Cytochrome c n=1 Tax=Algoriphagus boseongensis TaxID=1442587 RepID=A0A4R6T6B1_9BACT|nr:PQQ-dependent sugar dehydrogenase [Algoriphagus boseongensis]TDQ18480.1 cytochrome c [Algoriphagus boseongensis]
MKKNWAFGLILLLSIWGCAKDEVDPFATIKPEESRFNKITLVEKLNEPMELEVLDNFDVLFIERGGKLRKFVSESGEIEEIGFLDVYAQSEDGLLGLAKDPKFNENQWIYLYYAPAGPDSINRLSRFTLTDGLLDKSTEKILLEVPVFRGCCHSGGSLEFDSKGNLFLSLGDDTTPFESSNYNPIDERAGRPGNVDAQKTSGNTNDLRGSIIRITPTAEGGYTIPEGNLFPQGTPNTRPEIYVKGNRNPFRIAVDQRNGNLFWGEVGPDASVDSMGRGPKGHDEFNLATKPGYFGWPYFVGNNKPYWKFDFEKGESLFEFDPKAPKNTSPNSTGLEILPPATPALIWYPYDESVEFPMLGTGGRNAMAGPVYYREDYEKSDVRFPGYFDGKVFFFDWMRNWIFTVKLTEDFLYDTMERFMPSTVFDKPVDMQFAKDGSLYILEYGTFWSSQNDDSGIYRIEFAAGNRKPQVKASADQYAGAAPLAVNFSSEGTVDFDPEDQLTYSWDFGNGKKSTEPNPSMTFEQAGTYQVKLSVVDSSGEKSETSLEIKVGNEAPIVELEWQGNRSFYFGKESLNYAVKVSDREDGEIDPSKVSFSIDYIEGGFDLIQAGHQQEAPISPGENYITQAGCKACHAIEKESVGPMYTAVSEKYKNQAEAKDYLVNKILKGGGGVWGERIMPGHPQLELAQVESMVEYILSLANPDAYKTKLPLQGVYTLDQVSNPEGYYLVQASYSDLGSNGIPSLTGRTSLTLRNSQVRAASANELKDVAKANGPQFQFVRFTAKGAWIRFDQIDLSGIREMILEVNPGNTKGKISIRSGSPEGAILGETKVLTKEDRPKNADQFFEVKINLVSTSGYQDLYFVFEPESEVSIWNTFNLNTFKVLR